MNLTDPENLVTSIGMITGTAVMYFLAIVGTKLVAYLKSVWTKIKGERKIIDVHKTIELDSKILASLFQASLELGADRVYVGQVHNGDHFTARNQSLRVTFTHEHCVRGVPYYRLRMPTLRISTFSHMLLAFLGIHTDGIVKLDDDEVSNDRAVYWADWDKAPSSVLREEDLDNGVQRILFSPIIDVQNKSIVAYVAADFGGRESNQAPSQFTALRDCASRLSYLLTKGE